MNSLRRAQTFEVRERPDAALRHYKQTACTSVRQSLQSAIGVRAHSLSNEFILAAIATHGSVPNAVRYLFNMDSRALLFKLDKLLLSWRVHKRNWNYNESDRLRHALIHYGIHPESPFVHLNKLSVNDLLDLWVTAKRMRNFQLSDALRAHLENLGYFPEVLRPKPVKLLGTEKKNKV